MEMIRLSLLVLCSLEQYPNHLYHYTREMLLLAREREVPPPPPKSLVLPSDGVPVPCTSNSVLCVHSIAFSSLGNVQEENQS